MQVEQKNIWEDVTRNAKRDNSNRAIAAYQANMPDAGAVAAFGGQEAYVQQKTAVSEAGNIDMATYSNPAKQGQEEKTVVEKIAGQEISSGQARSNEIAVVANTTSTEDLKKMEEDGFSISDADSHTIITVTDKIKAALAKAGVDVSSMGGTLTKEQLEEITGSPVVTQQIMDSLAANDLPATEENVQDSAEALAQAASIPEITKQAMSYLLKNDMEPTIRNLYLSNYSSSAENIVEPEQSGIDFGSLMPQIREIIAEEGTEGFIQVENRVNATLEAHHAIIATGGSVVYGKEAMEHLQEIGTVIYLEVAYPELEKRLEDIKGRGVVLRDGQTLYDLYLERTPLYEKYADIRISETGLDIEQTVEQIVDGITNLH